MTMYSIRLVCVSAADAAASPRLGTQLLCQQTLVIVSVGPCMLSWLATAVLLAFALSLESAR